MVADDGTIASNSPKNKKFSGRSIDKLHQGKLQKNSCGLDDLMVL
jgi:hypothetical protein